MTNISNPLLAVVCLLFAKTVFSSEIDLQKFADEKRIHLFNREIKTDSENHPGTVYLTRMANDGLAWIDNLSLTNATIELEVRGANRPGQSFVGIAFHGQDNETFDAVYLRPFNFQNEQRKNNSLQYISMPKNDWRALRSQFPGKYESSLNPSPQPDSWVKLKLLIEGKSLSIYIDDLNTPELEVTLIGQHQNGKIGLWVGNNSDGEFRNLKIVSN